MWLIDISFKWHFSFCLFVRHQGLTNILDNCDTESQLVATAPLEKKNVVFFLFLFFLFGCISGPAVCNEGPHTRKSRTHGVISRREIARIAMRLVACGGQLSSTGLSETAAAEGKAMGLHLMAPVVCICVCVSETACQ